MITKEYIEGLSQDETFMEQLEQAASNEEVCELFKSKGLEVTVEDVEEAIKQDVDNTYRFGVMTAFNDYVTNLEASTPVKSNLDLFYRD